MIYIVPISSKELARVVREFGYLHIRVLPSGTSSQTLDSADLFLPFRRRTSIVPRVVNVVRPTTLQMYYTERPPLFITTR